MYLSFEKGILVNKNAKSLPKVYYGLHMVEGVAEYRPEGEQPYRICILENTIKKMDATFPGKPVFVLHSEDDLKDILANIQELADGYVIESFFNQADGKHWAKFIVVSDKGHQAVQNGWKLSNAYIPQTIPKNGQWHGVDYSQEVTDGNYDHLAIVPNPRYEESIILTPEQFKAYNDGKLAALTKIANSKEKGETVMSKLSFFKKAKVEKIENATDLETLSVTLPLSKKEVTIVEAVALADKLENMQGYANGDHMVKVGEEELTVNDLIKKHGEVCNEMAEMKKAKENKEDEAEDQDIGNDDDEAMENEQAEDQDVGEKVDKKKENEDVDGKKDAVEKNKKKNTKELTAEEKAEKEANFKKLKNASEAAAKAAAKETISLSMDRVAVGRDRY